MPDMEKVINALHCRGQDLMIDLPACDGCDYQIQMVNRMGCDFRRLCKDAIALLKEQDAQKFFVDKSGKITPLPAVVRCKDCKHWRRCECGSYGSCEERDGFYDADWYCADGERKEGR